MTYTTAHSNTGSQTDPLSKARDRALNLMDTSQICLCCATRGTPSSALVLMSGAPGFVASTLEMPFDHLALVAGGACIPGSQVAVAVV